MDRYFVINCHVTTMSNVYEMLSGMYGFEKLVLSYFIYGKCWEIRIGRIKNGY